MRINTFFYSIRQGLKNIFRNKMFSLASVATMAACIFMFGLFYLSFQVWHRRLQPKSKGLQHCHKD